MDTVLTSHSGKGIAVITLQREPVNALNRETVLALDEAVRDASRLPDTRCIILSTGIRDFSAGADLKMARTFDPAAMGQWTYLIQRVFDAIERTDVPTIAAVRGAAMGGGLELALACDLRVVEPGARLALPEVNKGILPGAGGTQRLKRCVGYASAMELLLTGREVSGSEAFQLGIAHRLSDNALDGALALADELRGASGPSMAAIKRSLLGGEQFGYAYGTLQESTAACELATTAEYLEGVGGFGRT